MVNLTNQPRKEGRKRAGKKGHTSLRYCLVNSSKQQVKKKKGLGGRGVGGASKKALVTPFRYVVMFAASTKLIWKKRNTFSR